MGTGMKIGICIGLDQRDDYINLFLPLAANYQITFLTFRTDEIPPYESVPAEYQPVGDNITFKYFDYSEEMPDYMGGLEDVLADFPLVVTVNSLSLFSYQVHKGKLRFSFKLVVLETVTVPFYYDKFSNIISMRRELFSCADLFIVTSGLAKGCLIAEGINEGMIIFALPWMNPETHLASLKMTPSGKRFRNYINIKEDAHLMVAFGHMMSENSAFHLLTAIRLGNQLFSPEFSQNLFLLVVGETPAQEILKKRASEIGIGRQVIFLPDISGEYFNDIVLASDLCYAGFGETPHLENNQFSIDRYPFDLLRAMCFSRPIISTNTGITAEILHDAGILVDAGNPVELAEMIELVCTDQEISALIGRQIDQRLLTNHSRVGFQTSLFLAFEKLLLNQLSDHDFEQVNGEIAALKEAKRYSETILFILAQQQEQLFNKWQKSRLFVHLGDCYHNMGNIERSFSCFEQAIAADMNNFNAHLGLGKISISLAQYEDAHTFFTTVLQLDSINQKAMIGIGLASFHLCRMEECFTWLKKAFDVNPQNRQSVMMILQFSRQGFTSGSYAESQGFSPIQLAIGVLNDYLKANPQDIDMWLNLGRLYMELNQNKACSETLEKILSFDFDRSQIVDLLDFCKISHAI